MFCFPEGLEAPPEFCMKNLNKPKSYIETTTDYVVLRPNM